MMHVCIVYLLLINGHVLISVSGLWEVLTKDCFLKTTFVLPVLARHFILHCILRQHLGGDLLHHGMTTTTAHVYCSWMNHGLSLWRHWHGLLLLGPPSIPRNFQLSQIFASTWECFSILVEVALIHCSSTLHGNMHFLVHQGHLNFLQISWRRRINSKKWDILIYLYTRGHACCI